MEQKNKLPKEYCNLNFSKKITRWDEAIPLGNGETGCLIWGDSNAFRFSLDRCDIWDKVPYEGVLADNFTFETLVKLAKEGDTEEIRRIFDAPYNHATPTKLPAGKIIFDFGKSDKIHSLLDLSTAEATISIIGDKQITVKSYLHASKKVGVIKINLPLSAFSFKLQNPEFSIKKENEITENAIVNSVQTGDMKQLFYPAPEIFGGETEKWFTQQISKDFSYGVFIAASEKNGNTEIAYRVATSDDGVDWHENAMQVAIEMAAIGYDKALEGHCEWWAKYWNKSSISLPDSLFEKNWYLTNYLLASCSRKGSFPMPLQGVWTADDGKLPPWKGDYHHDLNTQLCYCSYFKANHLDEGESFIDFLWNLVDKAREFAKSFYNSKGLCLPAVMAIDGTPLGGWPMYTLTPLNQLWLCQSFERHFRFTGDMKFLEEKAYVYCAESMECILGILLTNEKGEYVLPASSSPEIHDDTTEAWVTPNSNYDLSLMRYVVIQLINFSKLLKNGKENYWQEVLNKLPPLAVNEQNVLMLSPDESLTESHRHHAHVMPIYPLRLMKYDDEQAKKIIDATVMNLEQLGTGFWCGYSFTWMAELYAVQGNGNGAAYQLEVFWKNTCSQNGFHLNGDFKKRGTSQFHYRPFTLEGNMCAADALQEMLLQTEDNTLNLFPAIPDEWLEGNVSFTDFRAENGLLVSAEMKDGKLASLALKPKYTGKIFIKNVDEVKSLRSNINIDISQNGEISLVGGSEYVLN